MAWPLPKDNLELSQKAQQALGLPEGFKVYSPFPFAGLNQQDSALAIDDKEFWWIENYIRLGNGYMRALWGIGSPLYTAPAGKTIIYFFWFNINGTPRCAVFLSDGTCVQVELNGTHSVISNTPGLFYVPGGYLPACLQWGSLYLVVSNNNTPDDFWIWDGALFYQAGTLGPTINITDAGAGYSFPPTITAYGGHGTGATFEAVVSAGSLISLVPLTTGIGYQPGDQVQLSFSGGGSDTSAILQAALTASAVISIVVTQPGVGYATVPTVAITGGGGSGATATAVIQNGKVVAINITSGGSGYTDAPTVTLSGGGATVGAEALAVLTPSAVAAISVIEGGTNFSGTPTLTVVGGGGSGAEATAAMSGGAISSVTVTNGGTGYSAAPAVVVQAGVNNAAAATVSLMPYGISGVALESYQSRLWAFHPYQATVQSTAGDFFVSAPGSLTDFATSDGGLLFQNTNRFLKAAYVAGRQSNGYLYTFGDSSVDVVSNVQTSGSPTSTTFNDQNTDPQTGTAWRDSIQDFARTELFANPFGVYGLYGGAVTKISGKLDQIFAAATFPSGLIPVPGSLPLTPSSAVVNFFGVKCYMLLLTINDPFIDEPRNVVLVWNEKEWFVFSQEITLTFISTQETNSVLTAWGTDGKTLVQLGAQPSTKIAKTLRSKMYGAPMSLIAKSTLGFYLQASDFTNLGLTFDAAITSWGVQTQDTGAMPPALTIAIPQISMSAPWPAAPLYAAAAAELVQSGTNEDLGPVWGQNLGFSVVSTDADYAIYNVSLSYRDELGVS